MEQIKVKCKICGKEEFKPYCRAKKYVTCSKKCMGIYFSKKDIFNCECNYCGKPLFRKKYELEKRKFHYCNALCMGNHRQTLYSGESNPHYIGKDIDMNGYLMDIFTNKRIVSHKAVVFRTLGIKTMPKNVQVHHRDCNIKNNSPENLVILNHSDHRWLHKNYGSYTLTAFCNNKITLEALIDWSKDKERAKRLLNLNLINQIGLIKSDKLLENPEEDNQQPIISLND